MQHQHAEGDEEERDVGARPFGAVGASSEYTRIVRRVWFGDCVVSRVEPCVIATSDSCFDSVQLIFSVRPLPPG